MTSEFLELQESMNNVQKTNGKSTLTVRGSAKVNTETRPRRLKCLLDLPDAKVWHDRREKKVRVELTIPTVCVDMTATLLNLTSQVTKCFAINRTSLLPRKK